jgi:quercetin dioxygenase-like cupin family protein
VLVGENQLAEPRRATVSTIPKVYFVSAVVKDRKAVFFHAASARRHLLLSAAAHRLTDLPTLPFHSTIMSPTESSSRSCTLYTWDEMPRETVSPMLDRRLITGDRMMLAHVSLKKGCIVPKHSHENEQITYILEGALKFWLGEDQSEIVVVSAGQVLHIPSNVPHQAEALEDTLDVDIFDPPRQDWLNKTDSYLRK